MSDSDNELEHKITVGDMAVYRGIGIVATTWATLELVVDSTIWRLMGTAPAVGACITGNMPSIFPKMDALIALCHLRGAQSKTTKKLSAIKNEMYALAQERAAAVHGAVAGFVQEDGSELTQQVRIKSRGEPFFGTQPVSPESLEAVWHDIGKMHLKFIDVLPTLWAEISPLPENSPE